MVLYSIYYEIVQVPPQIYDAFIAAVEKGNIKTMPNRSMPATPQPTPGALLLGDAFNMRHPLTGGGMTVALSDIVLLRDLLRPLRNLNDAPALCKYLESFYTLRKVSWISITCCFLRWHYMLKSWFHEHFVHVWNCSTVSFFFLVIFLLQYSIQWQISSQFLHCV